ncbi:Gfo/Idh/MocA family oxidoreductase [Microbacterium sp. CFH 90308]|uniref:Gfo/Idh/MocA family oxidoreductase n=1 Tax=Microbacterium salsuginis TaxID=2722803 RepID=A0ABX1KB56_9MICO|nr:Gfo/Idh/MocA family oxidoreductase [Microbacterium sp. CFH 90308]NLP84184.1 Gfo/Idh/MocA family oxidoreductase [Microbacterium sp. CFH 90308]
MSVRIGFIGAGWWSATTHAPAVASSAHASVVGVVDPDRVRADEFVRRFGGEVHADVTSLLREGAPDGVVVATPHATHAPISRTAIEHGVGVLVEKPVALTAADARALRDLAHESAVPLIVSHPYLFHPLTPRVRSLLADGAIGDLVSVTGAFDSVVAHLIRGRLDDGPARDYQGFAPQAGTYSDPALAGGGQGQSQFGHLVSLLFAEIDRPLVRVSANMLWERPPMDIALGATAMTADGAVVSLASAGTVRHWDDRTAWLRYTGTDGWLLHDAMHGRITASAGVLTDTDAEGSGSPYPASAPVLALIDVLRGETRSGDILADPANGAATVEFVEACYASALAATET